LDENGEELSAIFANLNSITDSLAAVRFKETFEHLNAALATAEQVLQKLENGEGSAGLLINDPELYNNLNSAAEELDELLLDLKHNPKRYIDLSLFGGKKKYDEAENRRKEAEAEQKVKESGQ
jgi:phospholipid/cholesterol/gamma-HCH transport system substrate-binding protein